MVTDKQALVNLMVEDSLKNKYTFNRKSLAWEDKSTGILYSRRALAIKLSPSASSSQVTITENTISLFERCNRLLPTAYEWVKEIVYSMKYDFATNTYGSGLSSSEIAINTLLDTPNCIFSRSSLLDAFERCTRERSEAAMAAIIARPELSESVDSNLVETFVTALTGKRDIKAEAVIKHFIWQVKRKTHNMEVTNHMMPILYGLTGSGKSEAVKKLLAPIAELCMSMNFTQLTDDRNYPSIFGRKYVAILDEMARLDSADANQVKSLITAFTMPGRRMRTNDSKPLPQTLTLIGTSNLPLCDISRDTTGSRRFYEITCQDKIDWDVINSIDYTTLWMSVNHLEESPIGALLEDIKNTQMTIQRPKDLVEQFAEEMLEHSTSSVSSTSVYSAFKTWLEFNGRRGSCLTQNTFSRRLKALGFAFSHTAKGNTVNVTISLPFGMDN